MTRSPGRVLAGQGSCEWQPRGYGWSLIGLGSSGTGREARSAWGGSETGGWGVCVCVWPKACDPAQKESLQVEGRARAKRLSGTEESTAGWNDVGWEVAVTLSPGPQLRNPRGKVGTL